MMINLGFELVFLVLGVWCSDYYIIVFLLKYCFLVNELVNVGRVFWIGWV